jgi:hypothetical protein
MNAPTRKKCLLLTRGFQTDGAAAVMVVSLHVKGPTDQIMSAREWYHWIGLGWNIPRYGFLTFKF